MAGVVEDRDVYLQAFGELEKALPPGTLAWTAPLRRTALDRFAEIGFPTSRDEAWKYTSVAPIAKFRFSVSARPGRNPITPSRIDAFLFPPPPANRLVFIDGHLSPDHSTRGPLPEGVRVMSLAAALVDERDLVEPHLARHADFGTQAFTALNTAFMTDGAFVFIPRGIAVEAPIHLLFVSTSLNGPVACQPRNLILAEDGSRAAIVESYAGAGDGGCFTNAVTEIVLGGGASLDHYKIGRENEKAFHVATIQVLQGRGSTFTSHSVALGGALVRNDLNVVLGGEGADATLNGLYVLAGRQHVDNHTTIDHATPHGSSRELYKGVLGGRARGVFDGKIIVRPDAQKTDARQVNRNLLVSEEALVDTKPQLEIRADDVKCTHAATIGQIDQEMLFYLRSRALDERTARGLLMRAFVGDVVSRMKIETLRSGLEALLATRMAAVTGGGGGS